MGIIWKSERLPFETHTEFCHACARETNWVPKGTTRRVCSGCKDTFPCGSCQHLDCAVERGLKYKQLTGGTWALTQPDLPARPGCWEVARLVNSKPQRVCEARTLAEAKAVCEILDVALEGVW